MAVKSALKITGYIVAFVISSIILLAFLVDANMFKPRIQTLAAEQGIALTMRGDLHWAYWPSIGLAVNEVSIADVVAPQKIIADVKKASFLIAFIPLMKGDFQVKHVLVDGAVIALDVNEQGVGNWENLLKKKNSVAVDEAPKTSTQISSNDLKLSIEKISLHNSQIIYADHAKGSKLALNNINLDMDNVNLKGAPFAMNFAWETQLSRIAGNQVTESQITETQTKAPPLWVKSQLHTNVIIGEDLNSLAFDNSELQLEIRSTDSFNLKLEYSLKLEDLKNSLHYHGKLTVPALNAKQLLSAFGVNHKAANDKALSELSLSADFSGDKKQIAFSSLNLTLDKTHFTGSVAVNDFASQAITADLQGDDINVDDYLAPALNNGAAAQGQVASTSSSVAATTGDETIVPLPLLRKLNLHATLAINSLVFSKMHLDKVQLDIEAKQGLIEQSLSTNVYAGSVHAKNTLDARGDKAQISFEAIVKSIDVAALLKDKGFDKSMQLTGKLHANASGRTNGITKNQLLDSLTTNLNFSGDKIRLAPLNIEQQFCKLVTLVNQQDAPQSTWNSFTELQGLLGKATIAKRVITVESVNANVEKLVLGTSGTLNLTNGSYDFVLPLKLNRDVNDTPTSITTSAQGCSVNSNYWVERSMTLLRCKGAYAQMNPAKDCRPDKEQLNGLIKDFSAYKLKEKHGAKLEEKKSELLKKLDEKLGGEGKAEKAKDLLKNLFKKKNDN